MAFSGRATPCAFTSQPIDDIQQWQSPVLTAIVYNCVMLSINFNTRWLSLATVAICVACNGCGDDPKPSPTQPETAADKTASEAPVTDRTVVALDDATPAADVSNQNPTSDKPPTSSNPPAQPIFRKSNTRPRHNDVELAAAGIRTYESKRLKLYTDIDPKLAVKLPPLIDAAYVAWEKYFGKLPANRERTDFQITGYLMQDKALFQQAGLIPDDLRPFVNGRHRGAEFWMNDQKYDYYRRHLVIHESTHCFMEAIAGERYFEELPAWYWEGMAEIFGTHHIDKQGQVEFRVMPADREQYAGLGRITIVRDEVEAGRRKSIVDVAAIKPVDFLGNDAYAWSWTLCQFLDTHPAYQKQFRQLGSLLTGSRFKQAFRQMVVAKKGQLPAEWALFIDGLQYGYDVERAAIDFRAGDPVVEVVSPVKTTVRANRGWQSAAMRVEKGKTYRATASGQFTLAQHPKPWVSDAGGISFDYFGGRRLGLLLGRIQTDQGEMLPVFQTRREHEFTPSASGTLFFRLNDSWSRLADNSGSVEVSVRPHQ